MDAADYMNVAVRDNVIEFLNYVNDLIHTDILNTENITAELVDNEFLEEVSNITSSHEGPAIYFGKSLKELKCIIRDSDDRTHDVNFFYKGPQRLIISAFKLPYSSLQEQEFKSVNDLICAVQKHLESLGGYLNELEHIDQCCCIMEPTRPTFKDDYRRIYLDERTWLHVEITPDGLATNVHLVGRSSHWHDKLNTGLLTWDHDNGIVENIMTVFDLTSFPVPEKKLNILECEQSPESITCGICLCSELPDNPGVPLPICQNRACGVHFHRTCLFEWLVACSGGRPSAFGVATGSCPTCLQPISCGAKDN